MLFKPTKSSSTTGVGQEQEDDDDDAGAGSAGPTRDAAPRPDDGQRRACSTRTSGKVPEGCKVLTVPAKHGRDHLLGATLRRLPGRPERRPAAGKTDYYLFKHGAYPNDRYATTASTRT